MAINLLRKPDGSIVEMAADASGNLAISSLPAALGQAAMAASLPVVIASNQSAVAVTLATAPALVASSAIIGAALDAGPNQVVTRTYTTSADATTAIAISPAPASGQKVVAMDVIVSALTALEFSIQEETSGTVFDSVFLPANGTVQLTPRGYFKTAIADKKFFGKASAAGQVRVFVNSFSEA